MNIKISHKRRISIIAAVLALLMVQTCLCGFTVLAGTADSTVKLSSNSYIAAADVSDVELTSGVYRIRNAGTGTYISSYKYTTKSVGKAYLAPMSVKDEGQCIFVEIQKDGSCFLIPQNDSGEYAFCWNSGTAAGCLLTKVKKAEAGDTARFDISKLANGLFTLAPAGGDNDLAVLSSSTLTTEMKHVYAAIADYSTGNNEQMWILEPVPTQRLTTAYGTTTVKLYSTGIFYVRKYPYNLTADDIQWTSTDESVIMVGKGGIYCALGEGKATITAAVDQASVSFIVEVSPEDAYTWYSQNNIFTSDWDGTILQNVYFSSGGVRRRFAVDAKKGTYYSNWIDSGCALCSVAMVLHNLGATLTNGFDLRSGQNGNLPADPYTVALANTGNVGIASESEVLYGNPTYMSWARVTKRFNVDGEAVSFRRVFTPSRAMIKSLLEEHPQGVIVELARPGKSHYVVFSKCINPEETTSSKIRFKVFDAAGYYPENGDGVDFEKSTAYIYEGYRYTSIRSVLIFDVVSNVNN